MSDAIRIQEPIGFLMHIQQYLQSKDYESVAELRRTASLIEGMLQSDGITVFRSDASVLAYRVFLRSSKTPKMSDKRRGGARMRTFEGLKELVDRDQIEGAFIRSQDGYTQYYRREE